MAEDAAEALGRGSFAEKEGSNLKRHKNTAKNVFRLLKYRTRDLYDEDQA